MTYELILKQMLDRVAADYPNLDRREGSIIYNALAPAAVELAIMYTELDNTRDESFVQTASREYLLVACQDMGIDISNFDASTGVHRGEFNVEVQVGSRWNCDLYNYTITEFIEQVADTGYYAYEMRCETAGTAPNNNVGDLTPITDIPDGLTYARITECLIEGENDRSDDEIRKAYYEYVNNTITDGNVNQYVRWCENYDGIGNCKVFPLWDGANTVKVSILSASNGVASETLIDDFQNYLDPGTTGMGNGVAPIGAFVTVSTATEREINVSANVTMKSGYTDTTPINEAIKKHFAEIAYEKTSVAYMTLGAVILNTSVVESITGLKINGGTDDIILGDEEIAILGTTNWTVV